MRLKPIEQQVVVVMGAASGIGRATALRLAARGARVVACARSESDLSTLVEEIRSSGGEARAKVVDVVDAAQVHEAAELAAREFGRIDSWIHLSAISIWATFEDTTPEEFRRVLEVNLLGQVHGARAALPHLRRGGGGALIHISSVESVISLPYNSAYAASKHGVTGFLDALRLELRREGAPISVTNILPATINTPLFETARTKLGVRPSGVPPVYDPGVVVDAILYAAEHPARDLYAGGAGKLLAALQKLSPRLVDAFLLRSAFEQQRSDEPKPLDSPDNLYDPLEGFGRVRGRLGPRVHRRSAYGWLQRHPAARAAVAGAAILGASLALGAVDAARR